MPQSNCLIQAGGKKRGQRVADPAMNTVGPKASSPCICGAGANSPAEVLQSEN
jgi:hypothetical protein